jgi:hypothetical protein
MKWSNVRRLAILVVLGCGIQGMSASRFSRTVLARPMIDPTIYVLHGSGPFRTSTATATVARVSGDRYSVTLVARNLPAPDSLHLGVVCHVYEAWLVSGNTLGGPKRVALPGLVLRPGTGTYLGHGSVSMRTITAVVITAQPNAHTPVPSASAFTLLTSVEQ